MIGPKSPCPRLSLVYLLALLLVVGAPTAAASTMLTNGHPVFVDIPPIPEELTLVAGEDGFNIVVPEGATQLVVEFVTEPSADMELAVEFDQDVGTEDIGNNLADFRVRPNPRGVARIEVNKTLTHPRLMAGTYFIGFFFSRPGGDTDGVLTATFDGPDIEPVRTIARSTFESDLEGWSRGSGDRSSSIQFFPDDGNPDGHARIRDVIGGAQEWFVAPSEFLVNYLEFNDPRFVFDIARFTGRSATNFAIELRVFGETGAWKWVGHTAPQVNGGWETFSASIRPDMWIPFEGTLAQFGQVFSNPTRLEVRATFTPFGGTTGLDNFRLLARGEQPVPTVLSAITAFSAGFDGWSRNYPASEKIDEASVGDKESKLIWNEFEGNPDGFIRLVEIGGPAPDAFVVSDLYLGNWTMLDSPRIEFEYRHRSVSGAVRPVTVRLIGGDTVFEWTGVLPGDVWSRQVANVVESEWVQASGGAAFEEVLANVRRIEISADLADGSELNSIDNFSLLTAGTPPVIQSLTVSPGALSFSGVATGPNPEPQTIDITAGGGDLRWEATIEGSEADRVSLSAASGDTPSEVRVEIDTQGLAAGSRQLAEITFTAVGATVEPFVLPVNVVLGAQPNPTPEISRNGVVNAASFGREFAGGVLATVFGRFLGGPSGGIAASFVGRNNDTLPTNINGVRVLILNLDGVLIAEAPLIYVGENQINFQMPFEAAAFAIVQVVVDNNGARSEPQSVPITQAAPGIFTSDGTRALAVNSDGTLNSPANPIRRRDVVVLFLTGQGPLAPSLPSGRAAPADPLVLAPLEAHARVGGHEAVIDFLGMAPGLVGVVQLNLRPSHFTPSGDQPVVVNIGGHGSNEAIISVR